MRGWIIFLRFLILYLISCSVNSEVFSSISEMQSLIDTEHQLLGILESFAGREKPEVAVVQKYYQAVRTLYVDAKLNGIVHPSSAFLHIKAFVHLQELIDALEVSRENIDVANFLDQIAEFRSAHVIPDQSDLRGAAVAISRLQGVYKISAEDFANGTFYELPVQPVLTINDCFILAENLFFGEEYDASAEWFQLILDQCATSSLEVSCDVELTGTTMGRLSYLSYLNENLSSAIHFAEKALELNPDYATAKELLHFYSSNNEEEISDLSGETATEPQANAGQDDTTDKADEQAETDGIDMYLGSQMDGSSYVGLCRNDSNFVPTAGSQATLFCSLSNLSDLFLILQPVKMEQISRDPDIFIFHDFASSFEVKHLLSIVNLGLERALVTTMEDPNADEAMELDNLVHVTHTRTAKNAWISHNHDDLTKRLSHRISSATKMDLRFAEEFQLANYGIAGHYDPHYDFFALDPRLPVPDGKEERIATFMLYLSDVEAGGATAFIRANISVWPKAGDAVFWMNLHRDGIGNEKTLHSGCPVIFGSKWVMNLWIKEKGHDQRRPCFLLPDSSFLKAKNAYSKLS